MTCRMVTKQILVCDGCSAEFRECPTAVEARAAAYSEGWRFPARVKADGNPALESSDACPACVPDWKAQPAKSNHPGRNTRRRP